MRMSEPSELSPLAEVLSLVPVLLGNLNIQLDQSFTTSLLSTWKGLELPHLVGSS